MAPRNVAFPDPQASSHSPVEECVLPHSPGPPSKRSKVKVCPECGEVFHQTPKYRLHVASHHRPVLVCNLCTFTTTEPKELKLHKSSHKRENPGNECHLCHKTFVSDITLRIHQKNIHGVHVCKYCDSEYSTEQELRLHLRDQYGYTRKGKDYLDADDYKLRTLLPTSELKLPSAQHPGTRIRESRRLADRRDRLRELKGKNDGEVSSEDSTPTAALKCEVLLLEEEANTLQQTEALPSVCNAPFEQPSLAQTPFGQPLLICNPVGQPLSVMRSGSTLQSPAANTNELTTPEAIPVMYNTPLTQLSTLPGIPSGPPLLICNPIGQPVQVPRPNFLQSPALTHDLAVNPYSLATPKICVPSVQLPMCVPSSQPSALRYHPVMMSAPECDPSTSSSRQTAASEGRPATSTGRVLLPKLARKNVTEKRKGAVTKTRKVKLKVSCDVCGEIFRNTKNLRKHKKAKHKKSFQCAECNVVLPSSFRLLRHQRNTHGTKYRCRFACGILCNSQAELVDHYKNAHNKDYSRIECPHCHKGFIYKMALMKHIQKCKDCPPDETPPHMCGNCEGFFPNAEAYDDHAKSCVLSLRDKCKLKK